METSLGEYFGFFAGEKIHPYSSFDLTVSVNYSTQDDWMNDVVLNTSFYVRRDKIKHSIGVLLTPRDHPWKVQLNDKDGIVLEKFDSESERWNEWISYVKDCL